MKTRKLALIILFGSILITCSTLMDFESPKVKIISPKPESEVFGIVHIRVEASDNKKIDHIELILDGLKVLSVQSRSLTYEWDLSKTNQNANHTIVAKAFDPGGNWSEAKVEFFGYGRKPSPPELSEPADKFLSNNTKPVMKWTAVSFAQGYHLQIGDSLFARLPVNDSTLSVNQYSVSTSLLDATYFWRVRSRYNEGNWSEWSDIWKFIVMTQGPPAPVLSLPANGSSSNDNTPSFDWTDVNGTVKYELQVSSSNGFGSFAYHDSLTGSDYSGTALLLDGTYYWRVRGKDHLGNWGLWSAVWTFSILTQGPPAPAMNLPADGSSMNDSTPSFDWSDADGAVKYELQVSNSGEFAGYSVNETSLTSSAYVMSSSLPDGNYYWRVRGRDVFENWGAWSAAWTFTIDTQGPPAPGLSLPINGSTSNDNTPSFDWSDVSGTVKYELQVSSSNLFSSYAYYDSLTSSDYTASVSLLDGTCYWRVRSKDNVGNWGPWSEVWKFTINTQGPPAPALSLPSNGSASNDNTPSFDWTDVSGIVKYELQVSSSNGFGSFAYHDSLTASDYSGSASLLDGIYYWRVRGKDAFGNSGGWSAVWTFTIDTQGPSAPTLILPSNGSSTNEGMPSFDWTDISGAVKYELQISKSSGFGSYAYHDSLTSSHYTATASLLDGTYYWRVRCKDHLGNWGSWTETWTFSISTQGPSAPILILPANESSTNDNTPSFDWTDVSGAMIYELQVSSSSGFGSYADHDSSASSNYTGITSLLDGIYYWRVRGKDNMGNWGFWSEVWTFTIDTQGPPAPALSLPADESSANNSMPSFDWTDVIGAVKYELQMSSSIGFDSYADNDSLTISSYSLNVSLFDGTYYWRVRGKDNLDNWGAWSEIWAFTIITQGPPAPTLIIPPNGISTNVNTPPFDWTDVGGTVQYELQISNSSGFESLLINQTALTSSEYTTASPLSDSTYYWRVRGRDDAGNWSEWSETWSLTIDTQGPAAPMLSLPANTSSQNDNTPSFDWGDVSDAVSYELQVDNNSSFESPEIEQTSLTTSDYTILTSLPDGTFYWHVRGRDGVGNWSGWSETWSLTIDTQGPSAPSLSLPANGSSTLDNTPAFDWGSVSGAHSYELQVDNDSGFGSPAVSQKNLTSSNYTAASSLSYGTYYWRVRSKDVLGNTGAWSSTWSFYVFDTGTLTDIDGNTYITVKIGTQWWMAENLKVTHYRNGESIPYISDDTDWSNLITGAYCYYDNSSSNVSIYGRLYNWYAVTDSRNIAPTGWHMSSDADWKTLEMYLGMSQSEADNSGQRGTDEGGKLKEVGCSHWLSPNTGATNEKGFSALPGGYRDYDGDYDFIGFQGIFWTSTLDYGELAWYRAMVSNQPYIWRDHGTKIYGFSVRCVKD